MKAILGLLIVLGARAEFIYSNQVVTITNAAGKVFENVRLVRFDRNGLIYMRTNALSGGTLSVFEISKPTAEMLGIGNEVARYQREASERNALVQSNAMNQRIEQLRREWKEEMGRPARDLTAAVENAVGEDKLFRNLEWTEYSLTAFVTLPFYLLTFQEKKTTAEALLYYGSLKSKRCSAVYFKDAYSGKEVGKLNAFGFSMK